MNKIYILNGPPGSGKDTIAAELYGESCVSLEFKGHLHKIAILLSGMHEDDYFDLYNQRELKEVPTEALLGFSPRGFLIHISEVMCKPHFGNNYFGISAAREVNEVLDVYSVIFSDGGFPDEVNVLSRIFGRDKVVVIHLYRDGCNFDNDSRDYILEKDTGIKPRVLLNDGTIEECVQKMRNICSA
jgi:hypothetical protein